MHSGRSAHLPRHAGALDKHCHRLLAVHQDRAETRAQRGERAQPARGSSVRPQGTALSPSSQGAASRAARASLPGCSLPPHRSPAPACDPTRTHRPTSSRCREKRPEPTRPRGEGRQGGGSLPPAPPSPPAALKVGSLFCIPKVKGPSLPVIKMPRPLIKGPITHEGHLLKYDVLHSHFSAVNY